MIELSVMGLQYHAHNDLQHPFPLPPKSRKLFLRDFMKLSFVGNLPALFKCGALTSVAKGIPIP